VIAMDGWQPDNGPGFGWPAERVWINPSPNAANLNMARAYPGTVMLEGTTLSEVFVEGTEPTETAPEPGEVTEGSSVTGEYGD